MIIGSTDEFIEIEELQRSQSNSDIGVYVKLKLQDFCGSYSGVFIGEPEISLFCEQLKSLNLSRQGFAKINSLTPDEFKLEIRSVGSLGKMEIEAQIHRHQYSGDKYWPIYLNGGFEVEPNAIEQLLFYFNDFLGEHS
ncbi:hypothetical protein D1Z90_20355 [Motilimonas pumila]|uniref:Uncharacterized protein n=2 Tax=Motilimonas pumila TaxID=2303987 RepID=A0A418Y967_9GAMM|nr:hypothetical protein D1Z90_20355 [Motilimonas pumila]